MSIIGSELLLASAAATGYQVERSLRFNSSDSAYLSRTPSTAGNRQIFTWSGWIKRSGFGARQNFFQGGNHSAGSNSSYFEFGSSNILRVVEWNGSSETYTLETAQVFRDSGAWFHLLVAFDTTQATASNRIKVYLNGTQITVFATASYPAQNANTSISNNVIHNIGRDPAGGSSYFNGYLAEVHFIDGQALTPASFGEFDTNGVWQPKAYTGTYGTNGFRLDFSDNSAATATTLGKDRAGSNNWTPNNLSVTAGAGNDSLVDTPTSYGTDTGAGGEVRGNYCTLSPLIATSGPISNGNLEMVGANAWRNTKGTISVSTGKWYFEATYSGSQYGSALGNLAAGVGFAKSNTTTPNIDVNDSSLYGSILAFSQTGHVNNFNAPTSARSQIANGDVIGFALNYDAGTYTIYVNNTSTSSGSLNFTGELTPWTNAYYSGSYFILNTGQRPFAYTAPSGFKALCDQNLPAPTIAKPSTVMDVALWTGNGSARSITGLGFNPDLVWIKGRSGATDHALYDVVRGAQSRLESNTTDAEVTSDGGVTAFNSDGFSLGTLAQVNTNSATYAAWAWDAGSTTVTNTQGSITSQVRANASAGFSIVTFNYTASGSFTVGHGLGVAPSLIITKHRNRNSAWWVYHSSATSINQYLVLNTTAAVASLSGAWGAAAPTSTVFGGTDGTSGIAGDQDVAYCFAPVAGYSSFGSWQNNGSNDGTFVYLGFRPKFILLKNTDNVERWYIMDSSRHTYNVPPADATKLQPNLSDAEGTGLANTATIDFLSNGFKIRTTNTAGGEISFGTRTYIYAAFAENPFQFARAR